MIFQVEVEWTMKGSLLVEAPDEAKAREIAEDLSENGQGQMDDIGDAGDGTTIAKVAEIEGDEREQRVAKSNTEEWQENQD